MCNIETENYMRERSLHCDRLAIECFKTLEKDIDNVAQQLNNGLEIAKFLSGLENRIAIAISMKVAYNKRTKNE
jgi:hypothetical protein